ncbi:hypothetical protein MYA_3390 [Burkholderia sp. KJ006]|nr:hypothetical protein MYA_3390 [Burkholderia sp. KJ006]
MNVLDTLERSNEIGMFDDAFADIESFHDDLLPFGTLHD